MSISKSFFSLDNWRSYYSLETDETDNESIFVEQIQTQNEKGFITLFEKSENNGIFKIVFYKKHVSSILKSILIGNFSLPDFAQFKEEIDNLVNQSMLIKKLFDKPEFSKYSIQKKMYFPE